MLKIISGGTHSRRESLFLDEIKKASASDKDILVIIPDQFSFEYDKKLYSVLGAKSFNKIQTGGFNRLAELISKSYGRGSKENADDNAKIITMYKAVKRLKSEGNVKFYEKALKKSSFIKDLIDLIDELTRSGINADDLRIASEKADGTLQLKLFDISRLFEFYNDELDRGGLKDSLSALGEFYELALKNDYFKGKTVFIDSFTDFSVDELKLIECILKQSSQLTVSVVYSHENKARHFQSPFAETIRTIQALRNSAISQNVAIEEIEAKTESDSSSEEIAHIDRNLYCSECDTNDKCDNIKILAATDIYEETEYVCSEISRLTREFGYNYKDIAILSGNLNEISQTLEGTFERYEIPYFIDSNKRANQSALVRYLKSIFECVTTKKWNTEKLLRFIKSPFSVFWDYDINDIENYCITWNVNGVMWENDFTAPAPENSSLDRINQMRKSIIEPLSVFKDMSSDSTAKDICLALYELLDKIQLSQQMFSKIKIASNDEENDFELAREFKQLWKTVLSAVSAIYARVGEEKMSLRDFSDLFGLMISNIALSKPPQTVDCVRIASTDHSRLSDVKVLFVIETNDKIFPAEIKNDGLLTHREKKRLEDIKLNISSNPLRQIESERLNVYLALTMPEDKLYVTYSESNSKGELKRPSIVVPMLKKMFGNKETKVQDIPLDFFCTSFRTAFYKYLEKSTERDSLVSSIRESLKYSDTYQQKLDYITDITKKKEHKLDDTIAKEVFFQKGVNLSATRLNEYYTCPFSYFCKYGLKLKAPLAVEMNKLNTGNLIHSCFQKIMSMIDQNGKRVYNKDFLILDDNAIRVSIHEEFESYYNDYLGGDFGKTPSFKATLNRLENTAFYAIKNIQMELSDSLFVPEAFEYNLTKENGESILQLVVDDEVKINIRGSIDRADIFTDENGDKYIRIIDYKTNSTKIMLEELYNGLNLQMLIYLLAVTKSRNELNRDGKLKPSAILYSHIAYAKAKFNPAQIEEFNEANTLYEEIISERAKHCDFNGIVVKNEFTLNAFNKRFKGVFAPFTVNANGEIKKGALKNEEYLIGLEQYALLKVFEMAENLKSGKIMADPIKTSKELKCTYCDYWSICGNSSPKNPRRVDKSDVEKLDQAIEKLNSRK